MEVVDQAKGAAFAVSPATGGELASLRVRREGRWVELLYDAARRVPPAAGWRGRAPWLFPAVGRSFRGRLGRYALAGRTYSMPIHGFAHERPWELRTAPSGSVACRLLSDATTRKLYPFDFELGVEYRAVDAGVAARLSVLAAPGNDGPMPFSVGNHLTLAVPLRGGKPGACRVRCPARKEFVLAKTGLLSGARRPGRCAAGAALADDPDLKDMVLGDFPAGEVWAEVVDPGSFGVRVAQRELDTGEALTRPEHFRFVFYSDGRTFFCPEPWYGNPNSLNDGQGLVRLPPGKRFSWEMTATAFTPSANGGSPARGPRRSRKA